MRRFLHFILFVGLLSGCVEAEIDEAGQPLASVMPEVINISLDDDTTRVQLEASGKTVWTEGDYVSAFIRAMPTTSSVSMARRVIGMVSL